MVCVFWKEIYNMKKRKIIGKRNEFICFGNFYNICCYEYDVIIGI